MTRWVYPISPEAEKVEDLASAINVSQPIASLLVQRGIASFDEAKSYFRPSLDQLHDPFLMKDMGKAVARLEQAIQNHERILIYGDYDVDGTSAVALMYGFLKEFYEGVDFYIPDRYKEGYGISDTGIDWAAKNGFDLVISLDCGIKATKQIEQAKEKNIDFIICDHHLPGSQLPPAYAVLDPKQQDCSYPFKELSGCGIGFKLIDAFSQKKNRNREYLTPFLDLVVVSIASDIVPIVGENRILAYYGLKVLNTKPRPGLQALIELAGLKKEMSISGIVFGLAPRINASGRMDHGKTAVQLLLATEECEAAQYAKSLNHNNTKRKDIDDSITSEALSMIASSPKLQKAKSTVLFKEDWHKGVIGIVASRCIEKYHKPTIIMTASGNKATGSARSVKGFDIYEAIAACDDLLEQYGGHKYAAGLTMTFDKIEPFKQRFEEEVVKKIKEEQLTPRIQIDQIIDIEDVVFKFYRILKQMAPFGPGNGNPVFVSEGLQLAGQARVLKDAHLKFSVKNKDATYKIDAIGFGLSRYYDLISNGQPFKIAYTIEENNFMDRKTLQLMVKDIK